jgi:hypothetical protein
MDIAVAKLGRWPSVQHHKTEQKPQLPRWKKFVRATITILGDTEEILRGAEKTIARLLLTTVFVLGSFVIVETHSRQLALPSPSFQQGQLRVLRYPNYEQALPAVRRTKAELDDKNYQRCRCNHPTIVGRRVTRKQAPQQ